MRNIKANKKFKKNKKKQKKSERENSRTIVLTQHSSIKIFMVKNQS